MHRLPFPRLGLLAALLALTAQLALGATLPMRVVAPGGWVPICHAGSEGRSRWVPLAPADCLLCPMCSLLAAPVLPVDAPAPPEIPRIVAVEVAPMPDATAPRPRLMLRPFARGPPLTA